jgi:hypothetical protein
MRRAGGDEHALAGERLLPRWRATGQAAEKADRGVCLLSPASASFDRARISCGSAMRPGPLSPRSAMAPEFGPTTSTPSFCSVAMLRRVAGCSHIRGFIAGGDQDALVGREQRRRGEVVGMAVRHLGDQVGGGGCDDEEVGRARQGDMADIGLVRQREQVGEAFLARERGDRERRDELAPALVRMHGRRCRDPSAAGSAPGTYRRRCRRR